MSADTINGIEPTVISNDFKINKENVTVEGVYMSDDLWLYHYDNIKIVGCAVNGSIRNYSSATKGVVNNYFISSKAFNDFSVCVDSINFYITNSVICNRLFNYSSYTNRANHIEISNSIIHLSQLSTLYILNSSFINCIIFTNSTGTAGTLRSGNFAYYCVGIGSAYMFDNVAAAYGTQVGITNKTVASFSDIFKTFTGSNQSEFEDYSLTSAAASTYLGDDGTQVGIYGGSMPFNPKPNNPYITKCTVAEKSTPQGTLSVDIEVRPAQ